MNQDQLIGVRPQHPGHLDARPQLQAPAPQGQQPLQAQPQDALNAHPIYVRAPQPFKSGTDLDVYLRRFVAYANAANCPLRARRNLLLSLLDDKALTGVSRAIENGNANTLDELINELRRIEGYSLNRERFVTELRNRKRLRGESVWDYHLDLYKLAERAYPNDQRMKEGSLRESFIANMNDPYIASRLREAVNIGMEELLDHAINLHGCQQASTRQVNTLTEEKQPSKHCLELEAKLTQLVDLVSNMAVNNLMNCDYHD